ncbi:hypothetical protein HMPREF1548_00246 [Clostridium sp. KLE 1755]|nr:hypothetical protein HMPREF1548_00246 [Clostridium sp. KLE 1755]
MVSLSVIVKGQNSCHLYLLEPHRCPGFSLPLIYGASGNESIIQ